MRGYHKRMLGILTVNPITAGEDQRTTRKRHTDSSSVVRSLVALLLGGCDKAHRVLGLTDELHELAGGTLPVVEQCRVLGWGREPGTSQKLKPKSWFWRLLCRFSPPRLL